MRYKLILEYDGSNYSGWQQQKNAKTIQGTLIETFEKVLSANGGKYIDIQGSGRTDAGVHAYGQVAHLDCETRLKPRQLQALLNAEMPPSIHILSIEKVPPRFHARHWASSRQYLYRISKRRNAFDRKYICWIEEELNIPAMQKALQDTLGMHDFASFSRKPAKEKSTQVLVESASITEQDDLILVRIQASHFLWNMVRNLVGTLVEIGKGDLPVSTVADALTTYDDSISHYRMPPAGLFLEHVEYKRHTEANTE